MEDIHNDYVQEFIKEGELILNQFDYQIKPNVINGSDGLTSIDLISNRSNQVEYIVRFAYNRLDFNLGVIVYEALNGNVNLNRMLLPKVINSESDTYGYMVQNRTHEIKRLINDICNQLMIISNNK